jgi:WD40 repeat protein
MITSFRVMKDDKLAFSGGKDKYLKVTNLQTQAQIHDTHIHEVVTDLTFSGDEQYLFLVDKNNKIHVYYVPQWVLLCKITTDFEFKIGNIFLSMDNMYLIVSDLRHDGYPIVADTQGEVRYWNLQTNSKSLQLNLGYDENEG